MGEIILRRKAEQDLLEIALFIALDDAEAARKVVDGIHRAMKRLKSFPYSGRRCEDLSETVYELVVPRLPYIVVYRLHGGRSRREIEHGSNDEDACGVEVLAVFHTARKR